MRTGRGFRACRLRADVLKPTSDRIGQYRRFRDERFGRLGEHLREAGTAPEPRRNRRPPRSDRPAREAASGLGRAGRASFAARRDAARRHAVEKYEAAGGLRQTLDRLASSPAGGAG